MFSRDELWLIQGLVADKREAVLREADMIASVRRRWAEGRGRNGQRAGDAAYNHVKQFAVQLEKLRTKIHSNLAQAPAPQKQQGV